MAQDSFLDVVDHSELNFEVLEGMCIFKIVLKEMSAQVWLLKQDITPCPHNTTNSEKSFRRNLHP